MEVASLGFESFGRRTEGFLHEILSYKRLPTLAEEGDLGGLKEMPGQSGAL